MSLPQDLAQIRAIVTRLPIRRILPGPARHPRIALFAATRDGDSAEETQAALQRMRDDPEFLERNRAADTDFRIYELDLDHPVAELKPDELAQTIAYGMTAIEPGPDLFCLGGVSPADDVLRGISVAIERNGDPLAVLGQLGGRDTACLVGAIIASRMAVVPLVIDGPQAVAAASIIHAIAPHAVTHCSIPSGSPYLDMAVLLEITPLSFAPHEYPVSLVGAIEAWRIAPHGFA